MTIYVEIEKLLKQTAQTVTDVVDSNEKFEPTIGTMWCRTSFMPGKSTTMTLGPEHCSEYSGLYRIDIFADKGKSMEAVNALVDKFIAAYKAVPMIETDDYNNYNGGIRVYTGEVWRETARFEPVWVNVPVFISWKTHYQHNQA